MTEVPVLSTVAPLVVTPLVGLPEVRAGDDLAALLVGALRETGIGLADGDLLVVSSKVVSKVLGLSAGGGERDAVVLEESRRVVAERRTGPGTVTRVVESLAGPVMAAAGVDASNTGTVELLLLPRDPDAAARALLDALLAAWGATPRVGLVLSDTAGRPWRGGQTDFALGAAGTELVEDLRGGVDADGRTLTVTARCLADEAAAAADLVKGKDRRVPAAHLRGVAGLVPSRPDASSPDASSPSGPVPPGGVAGARALVRTGAGDWFSHGTYEAVRASLGVEAGTPRADAIGIPGTSGEPVDVRVERAIALALLGVGTVTATAEPVVGANGPVGAVVARLALTGDDALDLGRALGRLLPALWAERLAGEILRDTSGSGGRHGATVHVHVRARER